MCKNYRVHMEKHIAKTYFKDVLRHHRRKAGMTQEQLAGLTGISKGFLGKMETGQKWPNIDMLIRLAEALNICPGEMLNALVEKWKTKE